MNILINTFEKDDLLICESVKDYFSQQFPDKEFEWKRSGALITTSQEIDVEEITRVFEELVEMYPELKVEASCSYDVREDDRSAQWWGVARIYSEKEDGKTKIACSTSIYWN